MDYVRRTVTFLGPSSHRPPISVVGVHILNRPPTPAFIESVKYTGASLYSRSKELAVEKGASVVLMPVSSR
jgi:hypothetical protein